MTYCEIKLKTNDFNFITCSCYYSDRKRIKNTEDESWNLMKLKKGKNH